MTVSQSAPTPVRKRGWRFFVRLALVAVIGYFPIVYCVQLVSASQRLSHPKRVEVCCDTPATGGFDYEEVSFDTSDGLTLHGWMVPSQNGAAVIVVHGIDAQRVYMLRQTLMLADAGYGVLTFDVRAHGESEGDVLTYDGEDVVAARAYLETRDDVDPDRIGALGFSLGGIFVIEAAARDETIRAVIADEPGPVDFPDWPPAQTLTEWTWVPFDFVFYRQFPLWTGAPNPTPIIEAVGQIAPRPLMIIGSEGDRFFTYFYEHAGENATLWLHTPAPHGFAVVNYPEEYQAHIVDFFDETLAEE